MTNKLALVYPSQHNEIYSSEFLMSPLALAYVGAYTLPDGMSKCMMNKSATLLILMRGLKA